MRSGTLNVPGIVGFGEACALAAREMTEEYERVGILRDRLKQRLEEGLDGLQDFAYAWLLTWLHRPDRPVTPSGERGGRPAMRQVPFLLRREGRAMGMFATRTPRRVNPIGLSLVELLEVTGTTVRFAGVDLLDGTPVLDIKPYVTRFDRPPGEPRCGWFDQVAMREGSTPAQLAAPDPPG